MLADNGGGSGGFRRSRFLSAKPANCLSGNSGNTFVGLPVATAYADTADTLFTVHDNGAPAFHRRPPLWPGGERQSEGVDDIEVLSGSAFDRGQGVYWTPQSLL